MVFFVSVTALGAAEEDVAVAFVSFPVSFLTGEFCFSPGNTLFTKPTISLLSPNVNFATAFLRISPGNTFSSLLTSTHFPSVFILGYLRQTLFMSSAEAYFSSEATAISTLAFFIAA